MKVKSIVSKIKEYERLQGLIDNIQEAVDKLNEIDEAYATGGAARSSSYFTPYTTIDVKMNTENNTIVLNSKVTRLLYYEFLQLLKDKLDILKKTQNALEVE